MCSLEDMTERARHSQLELFYQGQDLNEKKPNSQFSNSFWVYISNYEKIILMVIGFIITGIISFCLGVERGKTITIPKLNPRFDIAEKQELKPPALVIGRNKKIVFGDNSKRFSVVGKVPYTFPHHKKDSGYIFKNQHKRFFADFFI